MTIQVSYYRESKVTSHARTVEFPTFSLESLIVTIKASMHNSEKFACFRSPDGRVVALNHSGEYITL